MLLDNHETHTSLEVINYSRENGIVLLSFPPHCTHKMQPLDRGIYGPFKSRCKTAFNDFIISNPGKPIGIYDIAKLTGDPYLRSFTLKNIISSFSSTGLWPINFTILNDDDFMGSFATDRADPEIKMKECQLPSTSAILKDSFTPSTNVNTSNVVDSEIDEVTAMITTMLIDIVNRITKPKIKILSVDIIRLLPKAGKAYLGRQMENLCWVIQNLHEHTGEGKNGGSSKNKTRNSGEKIYEKKTMPKRI